MRTPIAAAIVHREAPRPLRTGAPAVAFDDGAQRAISTMTRTATIAISSPAPSAYVCH